MWWSNLFKDMSPASFFNFSFLPKYGVFFVQGVEYTLLLAIVSVSLAVIPAMLLALMRLSRNKVVKTISGAYIAVFRSTPMLVQLSIIYFGLFGVISIPRVTILGFVDLSRFIPGVVALALNSSAYVAEIFRAGILAVDAGQMEAARAVGFTRAQTLRYVVAPQLVARTLPALTGQVASIIKDSSLLSVIAVIELTQTMREITATNYNFFGGFLLLGALYLVLTLPIMAVSRHFEKRLDYAH